MARITSLLLMVLLMVACTKDIVVDLPETEQKLVIEGNIESGQPPIVFLTRTQSYFSPTDLASLANVYITEGNVTVNDGDTTRPLTKLCSGSLSPELLVIAAQLTGVDIALLASINICAWTVDPTMDPFVGEPGRTYTLNVEADGKSASAVTTIPQIVPLDSLWFRLAQQNPNDDSLGFIWSSLSDPDTLGNGYRWFTKRINQKIGGGPKDVSFVAPLFSVFEDRFFSGLTFEFPNSRGSMPFSSAVDDNNEEAGYYKRGDTVVVKFASLGRKEYKFYESYAGNVSSQGDLFSNPANVESNITGGLGVWVGYGTSLDTVVCVP